MTTNKLDIFRLLAAADTRNFAFYQSLTPDEKKEFSPVVAIRWLSSVKDNFAEYYLAMTDAYVNRDFWALQKHPDLIWKLMACVGSRRKHSHQWINMPKRAVGNKIEEFLQRWYPGANRLELDIILGHFTLATFKEFVLDCGLDDKETKELIEHYKRLTGAADEPKRRKVHMQSLPQVF